MGMYRQNFIFSIWDRVEKDLFYCCLCTCCWEDSFCLVHSGGHCCQDRGKGEILKRRLLVPGRGEADERALGGRLAGMERRLLG